MNKDTLYELRYLRIGGICTIPGSQLHFITIVEQAPLQTSRCLIWWWPIDFPSALLGSGPTSADCGTFQGN